MQGIFVAGLGRAGRGLLGLARLHGVPVVGTWAGRRDAAGALPVLPETAHTLLLAVPDAQVAPLSQELWRMGRIPEGSTVLHLAARLPANAACPAADAPVEWGGFHPLQSFPADGPPLPGFWVGVGGTPGAQQHATDLAHALGLHPFVLPDNARVAYHAAAVLSSSLLLATLQAARTTLAHALGMPVDTATRMLAPLAAGAFANGLESPIEQAITGPIARGDAEAIAEHLASLTDRERAAYRTLTQIALETVRGRLNSEQIAKIDNILTK